MIPGCPASEFGLVETGSAFATRPAKGPACIFGEGGRGGGGESPFFSFLFLQESVSLPAPHDAFAQRAYMHGIGIAAGDRKKN